MKITLLLSDINFNFKIFKYKIHSKYLLSPMCEIGLSIVEIKVEHFSALMKLRF